MTERNPSTLAEGTVAEESIQRAGDVIIDQVSIITEKGEMDLFNYLIQFTLYEDLFSNVLVGSALISDAAGAISSLPLRGGEIFSISFRTPTYADDSSNIIKRSFVVYSIADRFLDGDKQQVYTLKLLPPEALVDNTTAISQAYTGLTDSIVSKIVEESLITIRHVHSGEKSAFILLGKEHKTSLKFVCPFWSPLQAINWVAARSISGSGNAPNVLFWESNKQFYFGSIEDLIQGQRKRGVLYAEYFYSTNDVRDPSAGNFSYLTADIDRGYKIIESITIPKQFDMMEGQDYGYYAGTLITHDIVSKQYYEQHWNYAANFQNFGHAESYSTGDGKIAEDKARAFPTFPLGTTQSPGAFRALRTQHFRNFEEYPDPKFTDWVMQRNSMMYQLSDLRLHITVPGRTDIEVGALVFMHFPKGTNKSDDFEKNFDPYMTGVYLITAIRHTVTLNGKHSMVLEIVKDSFKQVEE